MSESSKEPEKLDEKAVESVPEPAEAEKTPAKAEEKEDVKKNDAASSGAEKAADAETKTETAAKAIDPTKDVREISGKKLRYKGPRGRGGIDPDSITKTEPVFDKKVKDLTPNDRNTPVNLVVRVSKSPEIIVNRTYLSGDTLQVGVAQVGDATGVIALNLKNAQVSAVKSGDVVILRNALLEMNANRIYLRVDEWGLIEKCDEQQFDEVVKTTNDVSAIEWERVVV